MRRGLILEGGAMRGLFTAGVLDYFLENNITFDGMVGVSAGACFGCNFKSRQVGRSLRYNIRFAKDWRYCSIWSLLFTGDLFGANFCYHRLPKELDIFDNDAFAKNPMEFHIVVTDTRTGKPRYVRIDKIDDTALEWIHASASMPLVSRPVPIDGNIYLDGALTDSIPLDYFKQLGFTKNVVITTRPLGYRKEPMKENRILRYLLRKTPAIYDALLLRHKIYNESLEKIEQEATLGNILLITPPAPLPISRVSHDRIAMRQTYEMGHHTATLFAKNIANYLS